MAKKDKFTPKYCKSCIYAYACQSSPKECGEYGKKQPIDEKVQQRKNRRKFLKKEGYLSK